MKNRRRVGNKEHGHYHSECMQPAARRTVQFVDTETGVYYTLPDEEYEEEAHLLYQIHEGFGRGRAQPPRTVTAPPRVYTGSEGGGAPIGQTSEPPQPRTLFKTVDIPPQEQTALTMAKQSVWIIQRNNAARLARNNEGRESLGQEFSWGG
ncbi:hypothetical protein AXG93_2615s1030 [Marchantia polymorpha subsp. ruderalis]|uniref:Uncharacterized protein n=1 Tax=Marchantia polymorpha subsp. ruderalis TaxID=1480154 RepID=A0A176WCB4_MARPO|nr:hypothetical protein AXG93_2615s1030 [Marchantia polymorpha subsp. ruderalis]